jgi:hypothetical protein
MSAKEQNIMPNINDDASSTYEVSAEIAEAIRIFYHEFAYVDLYPRLDYFRGDSGEPEDLELADALENASALIATWLRSIGKLNIDALEGNPFRGDELAA